MARKRYDPRYGESWAVVVGINSYQHEMPLGYAVEDAEAFADVLIERFGFTGDKTCVLLDGSATLRNVQQAVHKLVRDAEEDDRVILFYAGHGYTVRAFGRDAGFLVPVDGSVDDTSTLLPWDDLVGTSRMIPAKHMLFVMDACYGGLIAQRALPPGSKRIVRDMLSRYSRQFLTAGKADETVADSGGPRLGHSVFTGYLLDALEGGLSTNDGLISANGLMAHVYDRVAKDAHSFQTPHYGFLHGDGDLFFTVPKIETDPGQPIDTGDTFIEVPPGLIAPEEEHMATSPAEQVKQFLSDRRYRIQLHDLLARELRSAQQRLGEEKFSDQGAVANGEFAQRLLAYEEAMDELLRIGILLGRWTDEDQQWAIREVVNTIGGDIESKGGLVLWLALRFYPLMLVIYTSGIAALSGDNYRALHALFSHSVRNPRRQEPARAVVAAAEAMLDVNRASAFQTIPGLEQKRTPQSEYLFTRLQPVVEDVLFVGNRYEPLFDRFEMLAALSHADYSDRDWGHPGRFAWKYWHYGNDGGNPFSELVKEADQHGDNWPPLRAGMFRGSHAHFAEVAERFRTGLLERLQWF